VLKVVERTRAELGEDGRLSMIPSFLGRGIFVIVLWDISIGNMPRIRALWVVSLTDQSCYQLKSIKIWRSILQHLMIHFCRIQREEASQSERESSRVVKSSSVVIVMVYRSQ
jgi:hypothetical protein